MEINLESIIFYILLIDAIGANILAWSGGQRWWQKHMNIIARHLPITRGWTSYYLVLVAVLGYVLLRNDLLVIPF